MTIQNLLHYVIQFLKYNLRAQSSDKIVDLTNLKLKKKSI